MIVEADGAPNRAARLLGRLGIWSGLDLLPAGEALDYARRVEALGYDSLWINETTGREPFALLGALAGATSRITLAAGITSIYARDANASHAGARTVSEFSGGRFVAGLGVSHPERVGPQRGHDYLPPLATMRAYLEAYHRAPYTGPASGGPDDEPPLVVAALRRGMVRLGATMADGAFPFFVPVTHVARVRAWLDEVANEREAEPTVGTRVRPALVVALPVVLTDDPSAGLEAARRYSTWYLSLVNYRGNLLECGYSEDELQPEQADRVLREVLAIGDAAAIRSRVTAMYEAGADHVALIPLRPDGRVPHLPTIEALAP
ncbi:MAG TPA: LLM class flavin-dependent oxidoreductase [Candidatus Dormibacteraeota bacterium]|nr:LLM class flavin-dependent oxidoreductase [Candidatus Dormibacteraeota bacterium]